LGRIVQEIQKKYRTHVDHCMLYLNSIHAAFGSRFVLREVIEHCVIELLVDTCNPQPLAENLKRLIVDSIAVVMPALMFVLAVPINAGGRWIQDDLLHEDLADQPENRTFVILDGDSGLTRQVKNQGQKRLINIAQGRKMRCSDIIKEFSMWLPETGPLAWYNAFISYSSQVPTEKQLALSLFRMLSSESIGIRAVRAFLDCERLKDGHDVRSESLKALCDSPVALIIVSRAGLRLMEEVHEDSEVNDTLLQWTLALELLTITGRRLQQCLVIVEGKSLSECPEVLSHGAELNLRDCSCTKVNGLVEKELKRIGLRASDKLQSRTVRGIVEEILKLEKVVSGYVRSNAANEWSMKHDSPCINKALACIDKSLPSDKVDIES
jgi:hypothetical protein